MSEGTITNLTVISHILKPYQAAIAANSGHVNVHETGAIEATGHKVLTVKTTDGKLTPELIEPILTFHCDEHMVQHKTVLYLKYDRTWNNILKARTQKVYQFCQKNQLYLYLDGVRLAMALAAKNNDQTFPDLAKLLMYFILAELKSALLLVRLLFLMIL